MKRESREWWPMPVILALQRLRHEGCCKFSQSGLCSKTLSQKAKTKQNKNRSECVERTAVLIY